MDNSSWWPPATKSRHRSCQRRMCGRWVTCASRSWEAPATGSRHRSCQRKMCGQLLLPLRTQQQQTAWSCDKEDACGQRLLVAASSKEQTQKLPKEDVWTAAAASAHQEARAAWSCDKEDAYGQQLLVAASSKEQTQKLPKEDGWTLGHQRKHLNSPRAGDSWASLTTADKGHGEPCPLPRQENQGLLSASLAVARGFSLICPWIGHDWTLAPSSPERVLLTATGF